MSFNTTQKNSGAHSRVATLIQIKFSKKKKKIRERKIIVEFILGVSKLIQKTKFSQKKKKLHFISSLQDDNVRT